VGACLLWRLTVVAGPQQKQHAIKVGKKGEITLTQPTEVGEVVLQPDTYVVQHRVAGRDHFVRFVELKPVDAHPTTEIPYTYTEQDKAGELKCRVEPATGTIKDTRVYTIDEGGTPRITMVAIRGEDVFHVF
jgi:hypothetical protein